MNSEVNRSMDECVDDLSNGRAALYKCTSEGIGRPQLGYLSGDMAYDLVFFVKKQIESGVEREWLKKGQSLSTHKFL